MDSATAQPIELGHGVNFGNMLEAPFEGAWGLMAEERFFDRVAEAGFDRTNWTKIVRAQAERVGLGWAYREFGAGFGNYDPQKKKWRLGLTRALRPGFTPR